MIIGISASGFCSIFLPWFELLCVVLSSGGFRAAAAAASFCSTTTSSPGSFVMLDKAISKASNASFVSRSSSSLSFSNRRILFSSFFNTARRLPFPAVCIISALTFRVALPISRLPLTISLYFQLFHLLFRLFKFFFKRNASFSYVTPSLCHSFGVF